MPIASRWWPLSEDMVDYEVNEPGVYELGSESNEVVYIGSSNQIVLRLREHLNEPSGSCLKRHARKFRVEYTPDYKTVERELYDDHVGLHGRPPTCNEARP